MLDPHYLTGSGPDTPAIVGVVLECIVGLAGIGTAVTLFPVVKRQNEAMALGLVAARTLEAAVIFVGAAPLLVLVAMRQGGVGAEGLLTAEVLVSLHQVLFLGQGLMPVFNALLLGTLLYRSRLVPRWLPTLGLIGAPLLLLSTLGTVFGLWDQTSPIAAVAGLPIALWELALGITLVARGFTPAPITAAIIAESEPA